VGHSLSFAISGSGASQKETLTDTTSSTQMCQVTDNSLTSGYPGIGVSPNDLVTQVQLGSVSAD
jgi:hypothetical protein